MVAVQSIAQEINDKFGPDEWSEILGDPPEQKATPPPPPPKPKLNEVRWADGSPIAPARTRSRTVQKSDYGYPIVNDGTVDPGEVVSSRDADEDGVGQL